MHGKCAKILTEEKQYLYADIMRQTKLYDDTMATNYTM